MGMTLKSKRELLGVTTVRYARAGRRGKTKILDEFTASTGYSRKYAIAVLKKPPPVTEPKGKRKRIRQRTYPSSLTAVLVLAWQNCGYVCSKRLKPFLPEMVQQLEAFGHVRVSEAERALLARMSPTTIDRLLKPVRDAVRPRGISTTRPAPASGGSSPYAPSPSAPRPVQVPWRSTWWPIVAKRPSATTW